MRDAQWSVLLIAATTLALALFAGTPFAAPQAEIPAASTALHNSKALVDINRASISELMQVPGMTRVWAERIVRFRPYRTKQDLAEDGVLPGTVYRRIKDYVIAHRLKP